MKIRKGKANYQLPPYAEILHVTVRTKDSPTYHLQRIRDSTTTRKLQGDPRFYMITSKGIEVSPTPKKSWQMTVRFLPPAMEV
mgnify:CR=1 FL=1